jgi:protein-tyrosine phosphatase
VQRRIDLEGCHNFRDLGGYAATGGRRLRWRWLFRADALHHLTPGGLAALRDELRVGLVVDLRSSGELAFDGRAAFEARPIRVQHLPLLESGVGDRAAATGAALADLYFDLAQSAGEPMARVVTLLADARTPAVFHCAAGKDRTGVVSAVILGLLGVSDEDIAADYAASGEALGTVVRRLRASAGYRRLLAALPPETLHARPETMKAFLALMRDAFGSMRAYAREIGVRDAAVERLAARLLED